MRLRPSSGPRLLPRPHSTHLSPHHLPRMQKRDGGGLLCGFDPVCAPTTSLACKSETEVAFYGVSTPFAPPPPPSRAKARRRWPFMGFRPRSRPTTSLACKSEVEVGFCGVSTPFGTPPPPSRASASPVCRATISLACESELGMAFYEFLTTTTTFLACKGEPEVVFFISYSFFLYLHTNRRRDYPSFKIIY